MLLKYAAAFLLKLSTLFYRKCPLFRMQQTSRGFGIVATKIGTSGPGRRGCKGNVVTNSLFFQKTVKLECTLRKMIEQYSWLLAMK